MKALENFFTNVSKTVLAVGTTATTGGFVAANDAAPPQPVLGAITAPAYSQAVDLCVAPIAAKEDVSTEIVMRSLKEEEVDGAIATMRSHAEELWEHMLPAGFDNRELIFKAVKELVINHPTLVLETQQNIENEFKKKEEASLNPWNGFKSKYPCDMCHDVLAAPVVLPCTHNFCGLCVHEMFNNCQSSEIEVAHRCTVCGCDQIKQEHAIYERTLDQTITIEVLVFPDCAEKREWQRRQHTFHDLLMKKTGRKEEEFVSLLSSGFVCLILALAATVTVLLTIHK